MKVLNLPSFEYKIKKKEKSTSIFDIIRKKYVVLTPEEWVRQHVIHFLMHQKKYPIGLIAVEKQFEVNKLKKRLDIAVFNSNGTPEIVVECKAFSVPITQKTFDQIARYNLKLNAEILMVSNGLQHYVCTLDKEMEQYHFLKELPQFKKKY